MPIQEPLGDNCGVPGTHCPVGLSCGDPMLPAHVPSGISCGAVPGTYWPSGVNVIGFIVTPLR